MLTGGQLLGIVHDVWVNVGGNWKSLQAWIS